MWKSLAHYLRHALGRNPRGWHPLLAVYYLTYACEFRCPYCCDGSGTPYHELRSPILRGADLDRLLGKLRRACDHLVITGGEPTLHPEFTDFLRMLPRHGFDGVVLTTIGYALPEHLDAVAASVKYLVFSLDTMDAEKGDAWLGRGSGCYAAILANIERARRYPGRRFEIVISSVATPDNLDDLSAVSAFARARGFRHAVCPVLRGVRPDARLAADPRYRALFDELIGHKRRGHAINGTVKYLEYMRDLRQFRCRPSTMVAVSPAGEVFYPCLEKGTVAGSLLEAPDLHALRAEGRRRHGPEPRCGNQCQSACALGFSLLLDYPSTIVGELSFILGGPIRRRLTRPDRGLPPA